MPSGVTRWLSGPKGWHRRSGSCWARDSWLLAGLSTARRVYPVCDPVRNACHHSMMIRRITPKRVLARVASSVFVHIGGMHLPEPRQLPFAPDAAWPGSWEVLAHFGQSAADRVLASRGGDRVEWPTRSRCGRRQRLLRCWHSCLFSDGVEGSCFEPQRESMSLDCFMGDMFAGVQRILKEFADRNGVGGRVWMQHANFGSRPRASSRTFGYA